MLVARTQEESDAYVEQEISHCLRLNKKPDLLVDDGETWLVDNIRGCLCRLPVFKPVTTMKTKKFGVLVIFDSVKDLLDSKFNKGIIIAYCNSVTFKKTKRTTNKVCGFSTYIDSYEFSDKEFSNSGGVYLNEVNEVEAYEAYILVVERNRFANMGVQVLLAHKIKKQDNLFTN